MKLVVVMNEDGGFGLAPCNCTLLHHTTKLVAITGGPGAGKSALLRVARQHFCRHVRVLPEVATALFSGGFPRDPDDEVTRAAQRAIFSVQREAERAAAVGGRVAVALCDRGTVDGLAYWPGRPDDLFASLGTTREAELARYAAVIHLHTPGARHYDLSTNPVRIENAAEARHIDGHIAEAWAGHPNVHVIANTTDFMAKVQHALLAIAKEIPRCCAP